MNNYFRNFAAIAILSSLLCPGYALSQDANQTPTSQGYPPSGHHHRHAANAQQQPAHSHAGGDPVRKEDDIKLNMLAGEYYNISSKSKAPVEKLGKLLKRVKAYHATLKTRTYGADDIIKDTVSLEHRIEAKKKKLAEEEAKNAPAPTPVPTPAAPANASAPAPSVSAVPPVPAPAPTPPISSVPLSPMPTHTP